MNMEHSWSSDYTNVSSINYKPSRSNTASPCNGNVRTSIVVALQETQKLRYAEVCQKPPKEPSPVQPLHECQANVVSTHRNEENGASEKHAEKLHEKPETRASKDHSDFRSNTIPKGAAGKIMA